MSAFDDLGLVPHPEGGAYRELYRSPMRVATPRGERSALTVIHFRLRRGERSLLHRCAHDELWQFVAGDPLELVWLAAPGALERRVIDAHPRVTHALVPATTWQCARSLGEATLTTCTLGPGFDFADFELLRDVPEARSAIQQRHPELQDFI